MFRLEVMLGVVAAAQRTTVPFQYAWRFHYGDDPTSPPGSGPGTGVFETDLANYSICEGMVVLVKFGVVSLSCSQHN